MKAACKFLAAALVALPGCAAIQRQEAADTEKLLAAAGFHMRLADTAERQQDLANMAPRQVVANRKDGKTVYTYADPENCNCLYVGGPKEYGEYRRLQVSQEIAQDQAEAAMNWDAWGPWGAGWEPMPIGY